MTTISSYHACAAQVCPAPADVSSRYIHNRRGRRPARSRAHQHRLASSVGEPGGGTAGACTAGLPEYRRRSPTRGGRRPTGGTYWGYDPPCIMIRASRRTSVSVEAIQVGPGSTCVLERGGRRPTPPLRARRGPRFQGNKSSICPTEGRTVRGGGRRRRGPGPEETHTPQPPPREESARSTHRCVVRGPPGDVRGRSGQERHGRPPTGSARQHFGAHCARPSLGGGECGPRRGVPEGASWRGPGQEAVTRGAVATTLPGYGMLWVRRAGAQLSDRRWGAGGTPASAHGSSGSIRQRRTTICPLHLKLRKWAHSGRGTRMPYSSNYSGFVPYPGL
jgi:hypothetical protein